jgi:hypothetical protein
MTPPGILSFDPPADQAAVMHLSAVDAVDGSSTGT